MLVIVNVKYSQILITPWWSQAVQVLQPGLNLTVHGCRCCLSWSEGGFSQASFTQDPGGVTGSDSGPVPQAAVTQTAATEFTFGSVQHQPDPEQQQLTWLKAHHPDQTRVW